MSAFQPTSVTFQPPLAEDPRKGALLAALNRNLGYRLTWNVPTVLALGVATAGLAPLVILLIRFRRFATGEKFQLEHVVEWTPASAELRDAGSGLGREWPIVVLLGFLVACAALGAAAIHVAVLGHDPLELWSLFAWQRFNASAAAYMLLLTLGYALLYVALWAHVRAIQSFERAMDPAADTIRIRCGGASVITGVALLIGGCVWGLPMMLAAGAHRRYINELSRDLRARVARRVEG